MSEALVSQLARALNLPPDAARHTLDHLVATLREQLDASGQATVPGLGTFVRSEGGLGFQPDDALARAVNHRYAGLRPITAGSPDDEAEPEPQPADPFAEVAPETAPVGFQPLDSIVETEEPEQPDATVETALPETDEASEPDPIDPFEETEPATELPVDDLIDERDVEDDLVDEIEPEEEAVSDTEPFEGQFDEELPDDEASVVAEDVLDDELASHEAAEASAPLEIIEPEAIEDDAAPVDSQAVTETDDEDPEAYALPSDAERENEDFDFEPEVTSDLDDDEVTADAAEPEIEAWAALPEEEPDAAEAADEVVSEEEADEGVLGSLNDLTQPDDDAELDDDHDEDEISAILPVMAGADADSADDGAAVDDAAKAAVAPAVAATSRDAAAKPAPSRRSPAVPILIGVVAVLGIVALLWFLNREPDAPIAEQPAPADTTAIAAGPPTDAQAPADTTTAPTETPTEPTAPAASADPLRSGEGIDRTAGGFAWVVGSELSREPAERRVAEFRAQGLRAGVIAEEAAGRTRYRVALGQFDSIEQAERFRSDLPAGVPTDTWLLRL